MSRSLLGIDIRKDAIAAVLVKGGIKGYYIDDTFLAPLQGKDSNNNGLAEALEGLIQKIDLSNTICTVSFPGDSISYRNLRVPFKENRKIRQVLPFELEPMLPIPVDDLVFDYQIVETGDTSRLLAAAAQQSIVDDYLQVLSNHGIDPVLLTAGALPTALSLIHLADTPENSLIIASGGVQHTLFVIANRKVQLSRSFLKSKTPLGDAQNILMNVQRTLNGFEELFQTEFVPQAVILSGFESNTENISNKISSMFDCPVAVADLINDTEVLQPAENFSITNREAFQNAAALALLELESISCINFHRHRSVLKQHLLDYKPRLIKTGCLVALSIILMISGVLIDGYAAKRQIRELDTQIMEIFKISFPAAQSVKYPAREMEAKLNELKKDLAGADQSDPLPRFIDILHRMSELIAGTIDVEFTRFVSGTDDITITGNTNDFNAVDEVKNRLEKEPWFKKVTISSSNKSKSGDRVEFKLKIQL